MLKYKEFDSRAVIFFFLAAVLLSWFYLLLVTHPMSELSNAVKLG